LKNAPSARQALPLAPHSAVYVFETSAAAAAGLCTQVFAVEPVGAVYCNSELIM
jgi:hypothetical protein